MADEFNVFISWSGDRSKWVAEYIRDWLPKVIQAAKPWMSEGDIEKGARSLEEISRKLQGTKVGIVCLTQENLNKPWILYESGALTKTIDEKTRLCTYLLGGLEPKDVPPPLGMFQHTQPNDNDTLRLMQTINQAVSSSPMPPDTLKSVFEKWWPDLEARIKGLPSSPPSAARKRTSDDIVIELLAYARANAENTESVQEQINEAVEILRRAPFALDPSSTFYPNIFTTPGQSFVLSPTHNLTTLRDLLTVKPTTEAEVEPKK